MPFVEAHGSPSRNGDCFLPRGCDEASDTWPVFSEPYFLTLLRGRVGQGLRGFYHTLRVFNLRFPIAPATLLKERLGFQRRDGGTLAVACVWAGTHEKEAERSSSGSPPRPDTGGPIWGIQVPAWGTPLCAPLPTHRLSFPDPAPQFTMYFTWTQGPAGRVLWEPPGQGPQALSLSRWCRRHWIPPHRTSARVSVSSAFCSKPVK